MDSSIIDNDNIRLLQDAEDVLLGTDRDALAHTISELWQLVLDVICTSLIVRIRAAALLRRAQDELHRHIILLTNTRHIRSVASTSIQVLTELNPHIDSESDLIHSWFLFVSSISLHLDRDMVYTSSDFDLKTLSASYAFL